jgi:hypothetical protein
VEKEEKGLIKKENQLEEEEHITKGNQSRKDIPTRKESITRGEHDDKY